MVLGCHNTGMPRFVILTHDHPFLHWDFMLEDGNILRTWRLDAEPDNALGVSAEPLPEHRRQYLDYEGPVGGDRGTVRRWDVGRYEIISETPTRLEIELYGEKLKTRAVLEAPEAAGHWALRLGEDFSATRM